MQRASTFFLLSFLLLLFSCQPEKANQPNNNPPADTLAPQEEAKISLFIDYRNHAPIHTIEGVKITEGMTVLEAMRSVKLLEIGTEDFGELGTLVTSINGIKNEIEPGMYWQFCIDNVYADGGADKLTLKDGQTVNWFLSKHGESPCKKVGE